MWTSTKFRSESNNVYLYIRVVSTSITRSRGYRVRLPRRPWRNKEVCVVSRLGRGKYFIFFI